MMEVTLHISCPESWVRDISEKFNIPIRFIECMPSKTHGGRCLIEIDKQPNIEEIVKAIKNHPLVKEIEKSHFRGGGMFASITTKRCGTCKALMQSNCFLASASSIKDGIIEWKVITGGKGALGDLLERLESSGCNVDLKKAIPMKRRTLLTFRQEEIIKFAYEQGYYDYPKKANLKHLADHFEISPSTLCEILQRAEKKVVWEHFWER